MSGLRQRAGRRHAVRSVMMLLSAVSLTAVTTVTFGTASAAADSAYTATASARLVGLDVVPDPSLLIDGALFDGGEAVAQARLDSLGISRGFAANTFPGTAVITLNGTLGLVLCQPPPPFPPCGTIPTEKLPAYPLAASSSYPLRPSDSRGGGPYQVAATSSRTTSTGSASDGGTRGMATTVLDPDTGNVVSRAESTVAGLTLGDSLALYGVRASAQASRAPSGRLEKKSSFAASLSILGQQVAVTPQGLTLAGQQASLPGATPLKPLLDALKAQGITIEPFPERVLPDGVISAGLRITVTVNLPQQDLPPPVPKPGVGLNKVTAVLTVGGSSVSVSNVALPSFGGVPGLPLPGLGAQTPASTSAGGLALAPAGLSGVPAGGTAPSVVAGPDGVTSAPSETWLSALPINVSLAGFYPVLVLVGALLFGVARLFSVLGGKPT